MKVLDALIAILSRVNGLLLELLRWAAMGLVVAISLVVAAGVFWRYVLNDSLSWYEEMAKFMMVWLVFMGAPVALRLGGHISIEMLPEALPPRLRSALWFIVTLIVAWFCWILAKYGFRFAWNGRTQTAIAIGDVSMLWIFASIPLGAAAMLSVAVQQALEHLANLFHPGSHDSDAFVRRHAPGLQTG
jgi:TRAP-type C4-dicarboxylate transport system permease small subunit